MDTKTETTTQRVLPWVIAILALADGFLHLSLDLVLFRGNFFQNDLSVQFLLNFIGYVVLTAAYLLGRRRLGRRYWVMDLVLICYAGASFVLWLGRGGPNPRGLGYPSKAIEVVLIIALLADWLGWLPRIARWLASLRS